MSNPVPVIDVAVLSRDNSALSPELTTAIRGQRGVITRLHRIIGCPQPGDPHRIATITRARNEARTRGDADWFMFLDDDVIPEADCMARLVHGLQCRPQYAAFAADYLDEQQRRRATTHVAMGATMFRRSLLDRIRFRWAPQKCECLCCCEDLRQLGYRIGYLPGVKARHLPTAGPSAEPNGCVEDVDCVHDLPATNAVPSSQANPQELSRSARILVAFDRRDVRRFRDVFLRSLRSSGNLQKVIVVGYGLYPSETRLLSHLPGVSVVRRPVDGRMAPVRRLEDFAEATQQLNSDTPVAYWDASDVIFQGSLDPLWGLTAKYPGKLLAVREPVGYPYNAAVTGWTRTIRHPEKRRTAFDLFSTNPFLNSGFGAGTASAMSAYFTEACRLRTSDSLAGTTDWGDQTAMNLYCHSNPARWQEISESWNYCVHDRRKGHVRVSAQGVVTCVDKTPVYVVHGNARSLPKMAIVR